MQMPGRSGDGGAPALVLVALLDSACVIDPARKTSYALD